MTTTLILCEKPSQAMDISKVFEDISKKDGYIKVSDSTLGIEGYLTWGVGHLVELREPHEYDDKYKNFKEYPILLNKEDFKFKVSEKTKDQFNKIKLIFKNNNIDEVIIATDPAREGENIAYKILNQLDVTNQVTIKRLWLTSKVESSIKKAFNNLLPQEKTYGFYKEGRAREFSDWLVGINLSRHFTNKAQQLGNDGIIHVGRVTSPTLNMVYVREKSINNFKAEKYFKVAAQVKKEDVEINTQLQNKFATADELHQFLFDNDITDLQQKGIVSDVVKDIKYTTPPKFYDLSALQEDMNDKYKLSAKETLKIAQNLYEKKLITYPRTDSRYITEDEEKMLLNNLEYVSKEVNQELNNELTNKNLINPSKIEDHYAILITEKNINDVDLTERETNVYMSILTNIAQNFMNKEKFEVTKVSVDVKNLEFEFKGKVIQDKGFKVLNSKSENDDIIPDFKKHEEVDVELDLLQKETTPPKRFTEKTLLKAMANPLETLEDEGLKSTIKEAKGLGIPATRADIIENLKKNKYIQIQKNKIYITKNGMLSCLMIEDNLLSKPDLTGQWEQYLDSISKNKKSDDTFINTINKMIETTISEEIPNQEEIKKVAKEKVKNNNIAKCPKCSSGYLVERKGFYGCSDYNNGCEFTLPKKLLEKNLPPTVIKALCENGETNKLKGFQSKKSGKKFDCKLQLDNEFKIKFVF
ncbi:type IA DNA topoisomerase [Staphylococcus aureus]|uniref:type IA DNA topoisomerase n=1 Tax=Staphylococcus aureus TaxID=1280 RepID=UPI00044BCD67|nr:type IA DNA topoisomerase [Staphylococcus aureus]EWR66273.1 transfer complex protein TraI [Staphylococcus aureus FVRH6079]HDA9871736.1 DNA topoisomerase III [Staphylococcus aureus]